MAREHKWYHSQETTEDIRVEERYEHGQKIGSEGRNFGWNAPSNITDNKRYADAYRAGYENGRKNQPKG